jgi:hypothetical protein
MFGRTSCIVAQDKWTFSAHQILYFVATLEVVHHDVGSVEFAPLEWGHVCFSGVPFWEEECKLIRNFVEET